MTKTSTPVDIWAGFTQTDLDDVVRYVRDAADQLELRDWEVGVSRYPLDEDSDSFAMIQVIYGQKRATITLCREWASIEASKRRRLVAHELIHCHLDSASAYVERVLPELVGKAATAAVVDAVRERIELATDALAEAVAPHLPEPTGGNPSPES